MEGDLSIERRSEPRIGLLVRSPCDFTRPRFLGKRLDPRLDKRFKRDTTSTHHDCGIGRVFPEVLPGGAGL